MTYILDLAVDLCDEIVLLSKGKLEAVDHAALDNEGFKERIIELLKDETEDDAEVDPDLIVAGEENIERTEGDETEENKSKWNLRKWNQGK